MARPPHRLTPDGAAGPSEKGPVIFLSAGEPSGDLHGAALARVLRTRIPDARLIGLGGPLMEAEGVRLLAGVDELAVMGFVEVLSRLPFFFRLRNRVFQALEDEGVDLVIPIDYPGFNMRLAHHARARGRRVLYYIAPQVWAWHSERARKLARDTDRIAVILPFEEEFLRSRGAEAEFVGHPLLDLPEPEGDRREWLRAHRLESDRPVLALMPGSRRQEVQRHLPLFSEAARRVQLTRPEIQVVIGAASGVPAGQYAGAPFPRTQDSRNLLRHATAALVKSGTTTLEAALSRTPFLVAYRMNAVTFQLARRLVRVPHIALANLVAGQRIVPEYVQDGANAAVLVKGLLSLLDEEGEARREMIENLKRVRDSLQRGGAAERVAEIAAELLESR